MLRLAGRQEIPTEGGIEPPDPIERGILARASLASVGESPSLVLDN
jgi:hypothetical protein